MSNVSLAYIEQKLDHLEAKAKTPPRVTVLAFHPMNGSSLKAFVSVKIGPLAIHDFRLIQQDGQRAYVAPPQIEYEVARGMASVKPMLEYPESWRGAIADAVMTAWHEHLENQ